MNEMNEKTQESHECRRQASEMAKNRRDESLECQFNEIFIAKLMKTGNYWKQN